MRISDWSSDVCSSDLADRDVIRAYHDPLMEEAGFVVLGGNLFDSAIMKTSVIGPAFRDRYLCRPGHENVFEGRAFVFQGPADSPRRIKVTALATAENYLLFVRSCGPTGPTCSAEVVHMQPP